MAEIRSLPTHKNGGNQRHYHIEEDNGARGYLNSWMVLIHVENKKEELEEKIPCVFSLIHHVYYTNGLGCTIGKPF